MRYFRALIISFILHAVVVMIAWIIAPKERLIPKQLTVVNLLEEPELPRRPSQPADDSKQFVRKAEIPDELKTSEKQKTGFASEDEQYVLEQMRARNTGMTANRSTVGNKEVPRVSTREKTPGLDSRLENKSQAANERKPRKRLDLTPKPSVNRVPSSVAPEGQPSSEMLERDIAGHNAGDITTEPQQSSRPADTSSDGSRSFVIPNFGGAERGVSTVGESLPDSIKFGDLTALNTDRHLYYTFYARIEESIRNRWVNYARAVLYSYTTGAQRLTGEETWTTKLEIILSPDGTFKRAVLRESSGIRGLDSAPVQAFRDAQQFPNPPQDMIKDGEIKLQYAFAVNVSPSYAQGSRSVE